MGVSQGDAATLRDAGVDPDQLVRIAAEFVRRHPLREPARDIVPLSGAERRLLRAAGARGLDADEATVAAAERRNLAVLAGEYAQLVAGADSADEVARRLGVKGSRVRQRVGERSLYALDTPAGRVFPRFQFHAAGVLPGLGRVLAALGPDAHPVGVARFFLTPTEDLESALLDGAVSPRDWLIAGLPVDAVVDLVGEH